MSDTPLLDKIQGPEDIKHYSSAELKALCKELRHRIIEVMAVNGGHLASNLGAVELTVAMHKVFDSPRDKFMWDVSHQTYSHKMLTGRNDRFHTVRTFEGLCGFCHPKESPHDHFHAGHAGTALSLALGVAKARNLRGGDEAVVPVIGDATLTCGVTLEALNNVRHDLRRFIVILNDNGMSISTNVGAITHILSRMLNNPTTNKFYQDVQSLVRRIPQYGKRLAIKGQKLTESIKNLVSPASFFEQYGLAYVGPIDGHDVDQVIDTLRQVKDSQRPVIIHALTTKGQGVEVAEKNPIKWHGAKPFDKCTFEPKVVDPKKPVKPTFPKVFGSHLVEMAERDAHIVAVTPAMVVGSCLTELAERFPERCIDVGMAESHAVTFAGGLAHGRSQKVVMSIYSTFLQRALDNLFHDVCLQELPVVFAIDRGGISGPDGATHHGIFDIAWLNAMPGMVIAQPRDGLVLKELMNAAFSFDRPTAIRYPNLAAELPERAIKQRHLGCGEILAEGSELLIVALGHTCHTAMAARELLQKSGVTATVLDPVFVKPLDEELLSKLLLTHKYVVTLEEHALRGGMGSVVNNFLMTEGYADVKVLNLGIPDRFIDQGSHGDLMKMLGLDPEGVAASIAEHMELPVPLVNKA